MMGDQLLLTRLGYHPAADGAYYEFHSLASEEGADEALLRALLAVVGVLALIVVGAVVCITTFDPNDLPRLVEAVREQSGLDLNLEGQLAWSFYPRLGFSVEQAEAWLPEQPHERRPSRHSSAPRSAWHSRRCFPARSPWRD